MFAVAVKKTDSPSQTGFSDGVTVTEICKLGYTVVIKVFDVAGLFVVQVVFDEVNTHIILSPFTGA